MVRKIKIELEDQPDVPDESVVSPAQEPDSPESENDATGNQDAEQTPNGDREEGETEPTKNRTMTEATNEGEAELAESREVAEAVSDEESEEELKEDPEEDGEKEPEAEPEESVAEEPFDVTPVPAAKAAGAVAARRVLQTPDSSMGRFRKWLGGSTQVGKPLKNKRVPEPQTEVIALEDPRDDEVVFTPAATRKELKALKSSRRNWSNVLKAAETTAHGAQEEIERSELKLKAVNEWVSQFDRSYQWKVQQRMDQQLARAESDLRTYEESAKNVEEFEPGRLVELRKSFHKLIARPALVAVILGVLVFLIPVLFQIPKVEALRTFYDPRLSAPLIFFGVVAIIVAVFFARRALGKDSIKNSTIVKWILLAIAAGLLILVLPALEDRARAELVPFLETNQWRIVIVIAVLFVAWLLVALSLYYQGWSRYRRGVETQLAKLYAVISGYVESQQEVNRLTLLYKQSSEWLKILALALYRPWTTPGDWEKSKDVDADFQDFPFALRIAEVDDQVGAKSAELERVIAAKLLVQGWRADAFDDLVSQVAADMGVAGEKFGVESLDRDLPHQTNNTRNILLKYLENSAKTLGAGGTEAASSNKYLVEVARTRLLTLIEQAQSIALSAARPPVNQITNDPLDEFQQESVEREESDSSENWDDFLRESLGTDEIVQPPLSVLNFTPEGQMNKAGEKPQTFVLIPQRLADALPKDVGSSVSMVPVSDHSARPVEIIARMDVAGPLDPSALRLLNVTRERSSDQGARKQEKTTIALQLCQSCHDATCPASADPARSCAYTAL